jgi:asparagine synthase (glutamine-hydrolysing)
LVDDILVKSDRMSMGAGIEARVPFLDHKLVEFAASLPQHLKVSGLSSKIVLKRLAERYLPHETIYRRKVGFTVPLTRWFAGPWRGLINDVLLSDRCLERGYYDPDVVRGIVSDHLGARVDREQGIWLMLALEMWHRLFVDDDGSEAAVDRVKADFARSLGTLAVAA